jgi:hypothetical protein
MNGLLDQFSKLEVQEEVISKTESIGMAKLTLEMDKELKKESQQIVKQELEKEFWPMGESPLRDEPISDPASSLLEGDVKPLISEAEKVLSYLAPTEFEDLNEVGFKMILISILRSSLCHITSELKVKKADGRNGYIDLLVESSDRKKAALLELKYVPLQFARFGVQSPKNAYPNEKAKFFHNQNQKLQESELFEVMVQLMTSKRQLEVISVLQHCKNAFELQAKVYWRSLKHKIPIENVFALVGIGNRIALFDENLYKQQR